MDDYYILCPKRPAGGEALIQHLISKDICEERQSESYHKCPGCVRSRLWQENHPADAVAADSVPVDSVPGDGVLDGKTKA